MSTAATPVASIRRAAIGLSQKLASSIVLEPDSITRCDLLYVWVMLSCCLAWFCLGDVERPIECVFCAVCENQSNLFGGD